LRALSGRIGGFLASWFMKREELCAKAALEVDGMLAEAQSSFAVS
jgi:hypothetical protein